MKRALTLLTVLAILCVLSLAVFSTATAATGGTIQLTLVIAAPDEPSWTLIIPADMTIPGPGETRLGEVRITDVELNGAEVSDSDSIKATIAEVTHFVSGENIIRYDLIAQDNNGKKLSGEEDCVAFYRFTDPPAAENDTLFINIDEEAYENAPSGTYSATITITSFFDRGE